MASLIVAGDTSGTVTLQAPGVAGSTVLTLPTTSGTIVTTAGGSTVPFALGSASAPSITFTGDTNTGMFSPAADTIAFAEGGTEAMRIDSSGNVGIGMVPNTKLEVSDSTAEVVTTQIRAQGGTLANRIARLSLVSNGNFSWAVDGTNNSMRFTRDGSETMRIDSSGNLLVGTTSAGSRGFTLYPQGSGSSPLATFSKNNDGSANCQAFTSGGTLIGTIALTNTTTTYNTSSDYRLKENIVPMTGALDIVQALKPVTYKWKVDGSNGQGFIAHELQEIVPDCVTGEKDALDKDGKPQYQGIDTSFLVATLTAAIQEQQALITQLQADVAELKGAA